MANQKRKICFIITSFIHYSRNLLILEELQKRDDVDLHLALGSAVILSKYFSKYANIENILKEQGFSNIHKVHFNLEGSQLITKAKTTGLGVIEFASLFRELGPDLVVIRGDRFEVLSAAVAACLMNIPIGHIEGGDVSGSIDESVRHAITKLAHLHFVTNETSRQRVLRMGENPDYVFDFGSPDIEVLAKLKASGLLNNTRCDLSQTGSGAKIDFSGDFLMVMYHPVTSEIASLATNTRILLKAIYDLGLPCLWFWPNLDAGAEEISHQLRVFRDKVPRHQIRFMRYLPPQDFLALLQRTRCLIGNSSSAFKECSFLGIPAVNVGSRQQGRTRANNVIDVGFNETEIKQAVKKQLEQGRYDKELLYFKEGASQRIAQVLANSPLYIQKTFFN